MLYIGPGKVIESQRDKVNFHCSDPRLSGARHKRFARGNGAVRRVGLVREYTSDYVLAGTITLLFRRLSFPLARKSLENIEQAITTGYLHLAQITSQRLEKAKGLRKKFQDKPLISFTDLTSMVGMEECGIVQILTEDGHFLHVGMGLQRIP